MFRASVNWLEAPQFLNNKKALSDIAQLLSPFDAYYNESQSWLGTNQHAISVFAGENAQQIDYNVWPSTKEFLGVKKYIVGSPNTNGSVASIMFSPRLGSTITYFL